jgi:DNA-binding response OmpR family regulator
MKGTNNVLIIDDEAIIHESLRKLLLNRGFAVTSAMHPLEGLEILKGTHFDLILTDQMMPTMNGVTLIEQLRAAGIMTPVVMITGYPEIETAISAIRLGAIDYIVKPFTRRELLGALNRALRLPLASPTTEPPTDRTSLNQQSAVYLRNHAWARLAEDATFEIGLEETFLRAVGRARVTLLPKAGAQLVQGKVGIRLINHLDELHAATMPLSGPVVAINEEAVQTPGALAAASWLLKIRATELDAELPALLLRTPRVDSEDMTPGGTVQ